MRSLTCYDSSSHLLIRSEKSGHNSMQTNFIKTYCTQTYSDVVQTNEIYNVWKKECNDNQNSLDKFDIIGRVRSENRAKNSIAISET